MIGRDLHEADPRAVGLLADELGVEADERCAPQAIDERRDARGILDERRIALRNARMLEDRWRLLAFGAVGLTVPRGSLAAPVARRGWGRRIWIGHGRGGERSRSVAAANRLPTMTPRSMGAGGGHARDGRSRRSAESEVCMLGPMVFVVAIAAVGLVLLVAIFWGIGVYNRLQRLRIRSQGAWSDIDVQLKRRHDLIPNLVETVKGYASHEKETLEAVMAARSGAMSARGPAESGAAEGMLTAALGRLFAVAEAYPDLKANQNFLQLQQELGQTENAIGFSRQSYNRSVGDYNEQIAVFPASIVAGLFNFEPGAFFEVADAAQREAPKVKF